MTDKEIEQFRNEFKSIVYQYSEIQSSNNRLRQLHVWDDMGSHQKAILKELDTKKAIQDKLTSLLKGHDYEDWKTTSKKLSVLSRRLKAAITTKQRCEENINNLIFKL